MIEIAGRKIGAEYPPLVIAEIGINHEGSLEVAKEMVDAAFRAGVEIVKHQTHIVEDEMSDAAKKVIPGNADVSIYEIMERCSLSEQEEFQLKEYVESKGDIGETLLNNIKIIETQKSRILSNNSENEFDEKFILQQGLDLKNKICL